MEGVNNARIKGIGDEEHQCSHSNGWLRYAARNGASRVSNSISLPVLAIEPKVRMLVVAALGGLNCLAYIFSNVNRVQLYFGMFTSKNSKYLVSKRLADRIYPFEVEHYC